MNALKKADQLTHGSHQWGFAGPLIDETAALLRRQHEAIVKLREALAELKAHAIQIENKVGYLSAKRKQEVSQIYNLAAKALKDTEDLK